MEIKIIEIKTKIRDFVIKQFWGFNQFTNKDNLVDMGIVTDDFVSCMVKFIENEFNITISADFNLNDLSINSISKFIEQKKRNQDTRSKPSKILDGNTEVMPTYS